MLDGITLLDTGTKVVSYTWGWSWGGFIAAIFNNASYCCLYYMYD